MQPWHYSQKSFAACNKTHCPMSSDSLSPSRQPSQPQPLCTWVSMTGWRKDEELAVVKAGNNAMSAIYTIAECSSMCRLHFMLKRHRNFRETFLRNYAQFQLQHPDWPQRTEQSLLSKFDAISRKIRKDSTAKFKFVSVSQVKGSKNGVSCKLSPNIEMLEEMTTRALDLAREMRIQMEKTEAQLETTMSLLHAQVSAERSRQDQLVRARARARARVFVCVCVCVCVVL